MATIKYATTSYLNATIASLKPFNRNGFNALKKEKNKAFACG